MYFQRIRDLREDCDLTQREVAEFLGIQQTVYSRYERGFQTIPVEHLEEAWNDLYEKYLGIHAETAAEGILQDVHWADGDFGYFPTYALGSAYASQFMAAMEKQIDVDEALRSGHYETIMTWLREHVHHYGCSLTNEEILQKATGESFNPAYYLRYLEEKYSRLYQL